MSVGEKFSSLHPHQQQHRVPKHFVHCSPIAYPEISVSHFSFWRRPRYPHISFHVFQNPGVEQLVEFLLATTAVVGARLPAALVSRRKYILGCSRFSVEGYLRLVGEGRSGAVEHLARWLPTGGATKRTRRTISCKTTFRITRNNGTLG